ncbi:MAG: NADPH-dependent F420 reductase [Chloroflexi bacterium]|nr:NADPH-dependent F420 reductase [Chloroflexota bacterium]
MGAERKEGQPEGNVEYWRISPSAILRAVTSTIAIVGGTGAEGRGLARRFVQAGRTVIVGSRQAERARAVAGEINDELTTSLVSGAENAEAARPADVVVLTIPFEGMAEAVRPLAAALEGKSVVSAVVPVEFVGGVPRLLHVAEGSAAQRLQALLPESRVIGAFHHLGSHTLADLEQPVAADVLVCGDDVAAKREVMALAGELPGVRAIDAGLLESAGYIEAFTVVLLRINRRYRAHAGLRITRLPESALAGDEA